MGKAQEGGSAGSLAVRGVLDGLQLVGELGVFGLEQDDLHLCDCGARVNAGGEIGEAAGSVEIRMGR